MNRIPRFTRLVAALGLGLSLATTLLASRPAQAEGEIRIAEQFGIVYLLLNVVRDQRLIEAVKQSGGDVYLNPQGGRHLYSPDVFQAHGLELQFLRMDELSYPQFSPDFVPSLSIIDVLMFNPPDEMQRLLGRYTLERPAPSSHLPGRSQRAMESES
mgnify:CR=1 FL=1